MEGGAQTNEGGEAKAEGGTAGLPPSTPHPSGADLRPSSALLLVASLFLLAAHFLPWAAHRTAALTQSAHDLSVSTNFTPGAGIFLNEWHLLPLWASAILLALAAQDASRAWRAAAGAAAIGIASLGFPTYPQVLTAFRSADYRLQFFLTLAIMLASAAIVVMGGRWRRLRPILALGCASAALVPAFGYLAIRPAIEALYRDQVGLGVGWWVTMVTASVVFVASSATIPQTLRQRRPLT